LDYIVGDALEPDLGLPAAVRTSRHPDDPSAGEGRQENRDAHWSGQPQFAQSAAQSTGARRLELEAAPCHDHDAIERGRRGGHDRLA
jgi:hypothetical protein